MNLNLFTNLLKERGIKYFDLADKIGIERRTMYNRLRNNGEHFRLKEVIAIQKVMNWSNATASEVFFNSK